MDNYRTHKLPVDGFCEIPHRGEGLVVIDRDDKELYIHIWDDGIEIAFSDKEDVTGDHEVAEFFTYDELVFLLKAMKAAA